MPNPIDTRGRAKARLKELRNIAPRTVSRPHPLPTMPAMAPAGPSWAVWALGLSVLLSLLGAALATVYARTGVAP